MSRNPAHCAPPPFSCVCPHTSHHLTNACRKKAKVREICMYCSKTSHASEDCPVKLAAEEGSGSDDAEISNSEGDDNEPEAEQSSEPDTMRHQPAAAQLSQSGRDTSYSPEVQASTQPHNCNIAFAACTNTYCLTLSWGYSIQAQGIT